LSGFVGIVASSLPGHRVCLGYVASSCLARSRLRHRFVGPGPREVGEPRREFLGRAATSATVGGAVGGHDGRPHEAEVGYAGCKPLIGYVYIVIR
jgi:hypothetical protein